MAKELIEVYNVVESGAVAGTAAAQQLPSICGRLAWITALKANSGKVYLGAAGVTVAALATNTTAGIELEAGDTIGPLPVSSLSAFYIICSSTADAISYLVMR